MAESHFRVVLDTNVMLAGLVSANSASQRVVDALMDREAVPLVSAPVMAEYQAVLLHMSPTKSRSAASGSSFLATRKTRCSWSWRLPAARRTS